MPVWGAGPFRDPSSVRADGCGRMPSGARPFWRRFSVAICPGATAPMDPLTFLRMSAVFGSFVIITRPVSSNAARIACATSSDSARRICIWFRTRVAVRPQYDAPAFAGRPGRQRARVHARKLAGGGGSVGPGFGRCDDDRQRGGIKRRASMTGSISLSFNGREPTVGSGTPAAGAVISTPPPGLGRISTVAPGFRVWNAPPGLAIAPSATPAPPVRSLSAQTGSAVARQSVRATSHALSIDWYLIVTPAKLASIHMSKCVNLCSPPVGRRRGKSQGL